MSDKEEVGSIARSFLDVSKGAMNVEAVTNPQGKINLTIKANCGKLADNLNSIRPQIMAAFGDDNADLGSELDRAIHFLRIADKFGLSVSLDPENAMENYQAVLNNMRDIPIELVNMPETFKAVNLLL